MVAQRRIGPLVVVLALILVVILARSFQVQVLEHEVWAGEAEEMVHGSQRIPSHRGRILDRQQRVLAQDEDQWQIHFRYREFRRGNPLAQVAHARSSLEMRAVTLREAEQHLETWAMELIALSPYALRQFTQGKPLPGTIDVELTPEEAREAWRDRRASDLRFYAAELLEVPARLRRRFQPDPESAEFQQSLLELAAKARGVPSQRLLEELTTRLAATRVELAVLAELLERDTGSKAVEGAQPLERLLVSLELARRSIEDETADALFIEACGFAPGRLSTRTLERWMDTAWIGRTLRWDDARRRTWLESRRTAFERALEESLLPRVLVRAELEEIQDRRADALMSELALLWTAPAHARRSSDGRASSWRELEEVLIVRDLGDLFSRPSGADTPEFAAHALAFQDPALHELAEMETDRWQVLGALCDLSRHADVARPQRADPQWQAPAGPIEAAQRWRQLFEGKRRLDHEAAQTELLWLARCIEARFQERIAQALERAFGSASPRDPLPLDPNRLSRAESVERQLSKDLSTRSVVACREPSFELVRLVARHASAYRGFELAATTRRVYPERDAQGQVIARTLLGDLRRPSLVDLLAQGALAQRVAELRSMLLRSSAEEEELRELSSQLLGSEEWVGGSGIEEYFDRELRGRHGYQETFSLVEEARVEALALARAPQDGADLVLTLDSQLQRVAEECLARPALPANSSSDPLWAANPVGAIVLVDLDGEVLVAASEPRQRGLAATPGRSRERSFLRERTLTRPTFNPPGSSFKPFVAAYALSELGLDPARRFPCVQLEDGGWGWKTMHCHGSSHGELSLRTALARSCNAYFAHLAEDIYSPQQLLDVAQCFGFGEPTGVRHLGLEGRSGLLENARLARTETLLSELEDSASAMRFANGLGRMEASPMQLARAMAGLVRGELPELRLVRSIGTDVVPGAVRPLTVDREALRMVLDAMDAVVNEPGGTAYDKGLDQLSLGFRFACKTGSADWARFAESPELTPDDRADMAQGKMRKHTWVMGFFPEESPRYVLVVYLHDVSETASHTAVYLASQFLKTAAIRTLVESGAAR